MLVHDHNAAVGTDIEFSSTLGPGQGSGFCSATKRLWEYASLRPRAKSEGLKLADHVLWLEHDFLLTRDLDPEPLAAILAQHRIYGDDPVAQVSLMRGPANEIEEAAGGLVASRLGEFTDEGRWLSHRAYFTSNPMMMTVDFMLAEPWLDDGQPHCEGRYGVSLFERGYRAGVWGDGSVYVHHVGQRTGTGY